MLRGWDQVLTWFEGRSSFHDAEILELHLDGAGDSYLRVHWWVMRDEVDAKGYYVLDKHAIVTFHLRGISKFELQGHSVRSIILDLRLDQVDEGLRLEITQSYGFSGSITASEVIVEITPGGPQPSS
jgi:hypothetical protein